MLNVIVMSKKPEPLKYGTELPHPLKDKEGYVDSWQIRDKKDCHPSHVTKVHEDEDIKSAVEFYKRYKDLKGYQKLKKEKPKLSNDFSLHTYTLKNAVYLNKDITPYNDWLLNKAFEDLKK